MAGTEGGELPPTHPGFNRDEHQRAVSGGVRGKDPFELLEMMTRCRLLTAMGTPEQDHM